MAKLSIKEICRLNELQKENTYKTVSDLNLSSIEMDANHLKHLVSNEWYKQKDIAAIGNFFCKAYRYEQEQFEVVGSLPQLEEVLKSNNPKQKPQFIIYNKNGNHWVSLCITPYMNGTTLIYKDSLGQSVPQDINDLLVKKFGVTNIKQHTVREQHDDYNCGPMSLLNLAIMMRSLKQLPKDFIDKFDTTQFVIHKDVIKFKTQLVTNFISKYVVDLSTEKEFKGKFHSLLKDIPYTEMTNFLNNQLQLFSALKKVAKPEVKKELQYTNYIDGNKGLIGELRHESANQVLIKNCEAEIAEIREVKEESYKLLLTKIKSLGLENYKWFIDENSIKAIDLEYFNNLKKHTVKSLITSSTESFSPIISSYIPGYEVAVNAAIANGTQTASNYIESKVDEGFQKIAQKLTVQIFDQYGKFSSYFNIAGHFPKECDKLNAVFDILSRLKISETSKVVSIIGAPLSPIFQESDILRAIFNQNSENIKYQKSTQEIYNQKLESKSLGEITDTTINNKEPKNTDPSETGIKPLEQLLAEIKVIENDGAQAISELERDYNIVKSFYNKWKEKNLESITQWACERKGHLLEKEVLETIAIMDRANELTTGGHHLRDTQILSVLSFLRAKEGKGKLCQINTGEGKTTIVSLLAVIKSLQGEEVDVITSNSVLAEEGVRDRGDFYKAFNLRVATNNPTEDYLNGPKSCYSADILYGSINNFQFDYLKDSFLGLGTRGNRGFGRVILDEVDNMIIDNAGHIAKLSGPFPGMESFRYIYIKIWQELTKAADDEEILQLYTRSDSQEINKDILDSIYNRLRNKVKEQLIKEFSGNQQDVQEHNLKQMIPLHLQDYAKSKIETWIEYAIKAKYLLDENKQYIIKEKEGEKIIIPVDYANTGVSLNNTIWSHGLHQFLQLKHNLRLTSESLTSSFVSNLGYINKYVTSKANPDCSATKHTKIFGLTGTLGSEAEQDLLSFIYNVNYAIIPPYKQKNFSKLPSVIIKDEALAQNISLFTLKEIDKGKAVLIICETIADLINIEEQLKRFPVRIKIYKDEDNSSITEEILEPGDIVIATNIAGRGTDFKTSSALKDNGGLHVITAFFPCNKRVHDQADGRTARQGNPGTAQSIIRESEVKKLGLEVKDLSDNNYDERLEEVRDKIEKERLSNIKKTRVEELNYQDAIFSKFAEKFVSLKKANATTEGFYNVLEDLKEAWAFWLENHNLEREKIKANINENCNVNEVTKDFEKFEEYAKQIIGGKICWNPYYSIKQAKLFLIQVDKLGKAEDSINNAIKLASNTNNLYSAYMALFELSINQGNALLERFKDIMAKVAVFGHFTEVKDNNYINKANGALLKAKDSLKSEINYINQLLFTNTDESSPSKHFSEDFSRILVPNAENQKNLLVKHLISRLATLSTYYYNVKSLLEQLQEEEGNGFIIQKKVTNYFKELSLEENREIIIDKEVGELKYIGLDSIYSIGKVPDVEPSIIQAAQGQIAGGLTLLAAAAVFPPLLIVNGPAAGALISEGICDIVMELIKFKGEEFNHTEYTKSKLISYGISLGTMGIGPLIMAMKTLSKSLKLCQKMSGALRKTPFMKNICSKVAAKLNKIEKLQLVKQIVPDLKKLDEVLTLNKAIKNIALETTMAVASCIIMDKIIAPILASSLDQLKPTIHEKVEEVLRTELSQELILPIKQEKIDSIVQDIVVEDLAQIIKDIAKDIIIGIAENSHNWKIKVVASMIDGIVSAVDLVRYPKEFCEIMNEQLKLVEESNKIGQYEDQNNFNCIVSMLKEVLSDVIYSRMVAMGSKIANVYIVNPAMSKMLNNSKEKGKKELKPDNDQINKYKTDSIREHLKTLGLAEGATSREINKAYKKLALEKHPDKPGGNSEKFQQIVEAKESLLSMSLMEAKRNMRENIISSSDKNEKQQELYEMSFPPQTRTDHNGNKDNKSINRQFDIFDARAIAKAEQCNIRIFDSEGNLIKQYGKKFNNGNSIELTYFKATNTELGHYAPKDPSKQAEVKFTGSNNCGFDSLAVFFKGKTGLDLISIANNNKLYIGKFLRKTNIFNDSILKGGAEGDASMVTMDTAQEYNNRLIKVNIKKKDENNTLKEEIDIFKKDILKSLNAMPQGVILAGGASIALQVEPSRPINDFDFVAPRGVIDSMKTIDGKPYIKIGNQNIVFSGVTKRGTITTHDYPIYSQGNIIGRAQVSIAVQQNENIEPVKGGEGVKMVSTFDHETQLKDIIPGSKGPKKDNHLQDYENVVIHNSGVVLRRLFPENSIDNAIPHGNSKNDNQLAGLSRNLSNNILGISSYFSKYTLEAIKDILKLRIKDAKLENVRILEGSYIFLENYNNVKEMMLEATYSDAKLILIPFNLFNKHAVGFIFAKDLDNLKIFYIDPSNDSMPDKLRDLIALNQIDLEQLFVEPQRYNNCGPEVIENFLLYLTSTRVSQEEAIAYHSYLLESQLLNNEGNILEQKCVEDEEIPLLLGNDEPYSYYNLSSR